MGMLIDGVWHDDADRSMQDGTYRREQSPLASRIDDGVLARLRENPESFTLIASMSCPWSHGAVLTRLFKGFGQSMGVHGAGGPRVQGYALQPQGPLAGLGFAHVHQLYTASDPSYTGRATVPVLWDAAQSAIISNSSADIIGALDAAGQGPSLFPDEHAQALAMFLPWMFENLSNAVYRAGKAQRQDEYEKATASVYAALHALEDRLAGQHYLFGDQMSVADVRLFAALVRYDSVYATHFRCTRYRLTDFPRLWQFTRRIYQMPDVAQSVDFEEIRRGYYLNDGSHNPFGLVADQPEIDWMADADL